MYKLRSSDISNEFHVTNLTEHPDKKEILLEKFSKVGLTSIRQLILLQHFNEKEYNSCIYYLTLGDELAFPISYKEAQLLFFALVVNRMFYEKEINIHLCEYNQTAVYMELTGGRFREIEKAVPTDESIVRYTTIIARHKCLFPSFEAHWKIPVSFFKDGNTLKTMVTFASVHKNPYAFLSIPKLDIVDFKVPKKLYLKFFTNLASISFRSGFVATDDTSKLKAAFDETVLEPFIQILIMNNFTKYSDIMTHDMTDYYYDSDIDALVGRLMTASSLLDARYNNTEQNKTDEKWIRLNEKEYRYLNKGANYLPIRNIAKNCIEIYIVP